MRGYSSFKYYCISVLLLSRFAGRAQVPDLSSIKKPATFFVDQSAAAAGDGTALHPFQQINTALAKAKSKNHAVIITISSGIYTENLVISNNTTLKGIKKPASPGRKSTGIVLRGSIQNNNPVTLRIDNLQIANAPLPGAIVVNNPGATTILEHITISKATRYGIYQRGGKLTVTDATILLTVPGIIPVTGKTNKEETVCYGTGIFIKNIIASLTDVKLQRNVQGLSADGASTVVDISNMLAENHVLTMREYFICGTHAPENGMAAIEARHGAMMRVQGIRVLDNDIRGLSVHHGARFIGHDVIVLRTKSVLCANRRKMGGINISVRNENAWLELSSFETGYAELCGFQFIEAKGRCSDGSVHHNVIGMNIQRQPADFNYEDLVSNVRFENNERNLDADVLPVPGVTIPDFR